MQKFAVVLPAAGLALLFVLLVITQLLGLNVVGRLTPLIGAIWLIFALLVLGLCITAPLVWCVLYYVRRTRNSRPDVMEAKSVNTGQGRCDD